MCELSKGSCFLKPDDVKSVYDGLYSRSELVAIAQACNQTKSKNSW